MSIDHLTCTGSKATLQTSDMSQSLWELASLLSTDFSINLSHGGRPTAFFPADVTVKCLAPHQVTGELVSFLLVWRLSWPRWDGFPESRTVWGGAAPCVLFSDPVPWCFPDSCRCLINAPAEVTSALLSSLALSQMKCLLYVNCCWILRVLLPRKSEFENKCFFLSLWCWKSPRKSAHNHTHRVPYR